MWNHHLRRLAIDWFLSVRMLRRIETLRHCILYPNIQTQLEQATGETWKRLEWMGILRIHHEAGIYWRHQAESHWNTFFSLWIWWLWCNVREQAHPKRNEAFKIIHRPQATLHLFLWLKQQMLHKLKEAKDLPSNKQIELNWIERTDRWSTHAAWQTSHCFNCDWLMNWLACLLCSGWVSISTQDCEVWCRKSNSILPALCDVLLNMMIVVLRCKNFCLIIVSIFAARRVALWTWPFSMTNK